MASPVPTSQPPTLSSAARAEHDVVSMVGMCLIVEFMMAPAEAEEPQQLRAFWADERSDSAPIARVALPQLHDFMFKMFALCMFTPECNVIALMFVIRILSYHPHLKVTSRNCKRLLLCALMIAQKYWDDTPLRNVDFSIAWGRVEPTEAAVSIERVNTMECVFLGALGFDLYIPEPKYSACIDELVSIVRMHEQSDARLLPLMKKHAEFMTGLSAKRFPWLQPFVSKMAAKKKRPSH